MRRTRAADPKNKKGDKRERGEEGGEEEEEKKEKKKRRGEGFFVLGSWVFLVQYIVLAKKKISRPALTRQGRERMPLWDIPRFVFN